VQNNPKAFCLGLLGYPIAHSKSPGLMATFAHDAGIQGMEYPLFETPEFPLDRLSWWVESGSPRGFNVTLPYKQKINAWINRYTPAAEAVGAINTVAVMPNGDWVGHNTDSDGFWESLPVVWKNSLVKKALLLGAGGAARAVHHALTSRGWQVTVVYRSSQPAWATHTLPWEVVKNHPLGAYSLLVQATPLGSPAFPGVAPEMNWKTLNNNALAIDLVYHPSPTPWMVEASLSGARSQNGLAMLHAQAKKAWEFWKSSGVIPEI
jgi:shikimate dehydrogenase